MSEHPLTSEIKALEEKRLAAMKTGDLSALANILDDELIYIHSSAVVDDKRAYLALIEDGTLVYDRFELISIKLLHVTPELVILSGRMKIDIHWSGVAKPLDNMFIASWVKRPDTGWRFLTWQSTAMPQPAH